jgi:hypothetical protein
MIIIHNIPISRLFHNSSTIIKIHFKVIFVPVDNAPFLRSKLCYQINAMEIMKNYLKSFMYFNFMHVFLLGEF